MLKVSVIVASYNQAEYLAEALDSVKSQTYDNWECVVVDDGSTDNTAAIANQYCEADGRFRYINQPNSGVSAARNNGIKQSSGDLILPLDGDDRIASSYIEKAVSYFSEHPDCDVVYCRAEFFGERQGEWILPDYSYEKILFNNSIFCSALFRRALFDQFGGYNINMVQGLEDWDFWISVLSPESKVYRLNEILFFYRIKQISRSTSARNNEEILERQMVINHPEKYSPYFDYIFKYPMVRNELVDVLNSKTYLAGRALLFPLRLVRNLFCKD